MSVGDRAGRGLALLVLAAVIAAGASSLYSTSGSAQESWRRAKAARREPIEAVEDRTVGAEYMSGVRAIRARVGPEQTVYLVDLQSREGGASYFALHYLAPRRIRKLGRWDRPGNRVAWQRLPRDANWVVLVRDFPAPLELQSAREFRSGRGRGRDR